MYWEFVIGLVIAIPIILLPVAFVRYLNISGILNAIRQARARRAIKGKHSGVR